MGKGRFGALAAAFLGLAVLSACGASDPEVGNSSGSSGGEPSAAAGAPGSSGALPSAGATALSGGAGGTDGASAAAGTTDTESGPPAGYYDGHASVPGAGQAEDTSAPTTVIGSGNPSGCTGEAFVSAVAKGGVITFDCGSAPVKIVLSSPAKVFNDKGTKLVIDGGNKVTLSGGGKSRILYMATCDKAQVYPPGPGDCNTNPGVQLVVQNLTFVDGNAAGVADDDNHGGGGAIYAQGGSLKVVHSRFFDNVCASLGSDVGGGAIRKLDYLVAAGAGPKRPVWIVNSTFGGRAGLGNSCANGGALSSIGVSWNIIDSWLSDNTAVGHGANDGDGGNGGAIYNDGNEIVMNISGSLLENNKANEGGSAVFFVSNDKSGSITVKDSITRGNPRGTFETPDMPGFYVIAKAPAVVDNSQILR